MVAVLGISAFYHDSAAALVVDGKIVAAAQEERFTRIKHDAGFPHQAVAYCLSQLEDVGSIHQVVFYDQPALKFERLLETYLAFAPRGLGSFTRAMSTWLGGKINQPRQIKDALIPMLPGVDLEQGLRFCSHHHSHAASAFFPSPFERAAILTMDGVGEWATTSLAIGDGTSVTPVKEIRFPHSIGLLYSAFTHYLGFKVNSGEYKVMGLAPYGEPRYVDLILENLINVKPDGSFWLDQDYFNYCAGQTMTAPKFHELFGAPPRRPESPLSQRDMDLAASIQEVTETVVLTLCRAIAAETGERNLCLAGGVALNCVANGLIQKEGIFDQIWIQPAAGDAGGALGAALSGYHEMLSGPRRVIPGDGMHGALLGPEYDQIDIEQRLRAAGAVFEVFNDNDLLDKVADALAAENVVGWFQGRMEFGPRALGNRSILGDPRSPAMQKAMNLKIKYRESFRPFAPSVLESACGQWFDLDAQSPYMLLVADVTDTHRFDVPAGQDATGLAKLGIPRSDIPAVTHVDGSARIQTVSPETNPRYHALLSAFAKRTGCPVLVNTSFNVRGEPIVCTPEDAFRCFMGTEIELLAIGNCLLQKGCQDPAKRVAYNERFDLD